MKVVTVREQIADIAERWKAQNWRFGQWLPATSFDAAAIYEQLKALDPETATAADVDAIMPARGWIGQTCNECGERVDEYLHLGEEPGYDACWVYLCRPCLERARSLWTSESAPFDPAVAGTVEPPQADHARKGSSPSWMQPDEE